MPHIDYFFATISPFTYMVGNRPAEIAAKHGATITYKPLDIMQLFGRTGGTPPKDRHPNRQEFRLKDLGYSAAMLDVPINVKPAHWPTNMAPSSYAIIAAQNAGGGDVGKLVADLTAACWAGEQDVSTDDVIRACLVGAGFDAGLADSGLMTSADEYASNLEEAVRRGVFGAPFFITDTDGRFFGQDRLDYLDAHLAGKF